MSIVVAVALGASLLSVLSRAHRRAGGEWLDGVVIGAATWLAVVGIAATLLAGLGVFGPASMSVAAGLLAVLGWPWRSARPPRRAWTRRGVLVPLLLVGLGLGLRWPPMDYPLAGRDQGTYTLRAQHTLRTGTLHATDPVLAEAGREAGERPGPADIQGLYHRRTEPWRRDRYEASYRPGFYLSDLDRGTIEPQFFHLHPMLMATAGLVVGPSRVAAVVVVYAALSVLAMLAVARRLWPRGPWAPLVGLLWACDPLSIWVLRTPLSEGPTAGLMLSGLLCVLRARDGDRGALGSAAVLLGALGWVRGNGWLAAPVLLAAQWLVPRADRRSRRAGLALAGMFGAAVVVHAPTTLPYLHDELLRQLPIAAPLTPGLLVTIVAAGLAAWFAVDELGPHRPREERWLRAAARAAPPLLAALLLAAVVAYLVARPAPVAAPFSRLDPVAALVGAPTLLLAGLGLAATVRRWPRDPSAAQAWMLGMAGIVVATVGLYAQRNLPQLGLYYYGRYLVPELLPALLLLSVEGLRTLHRWLRGERPGEARRRWSAGLVGLAFVGQWWSVAGVLVRHPVTRLPEFDGADRVVDYLASRLPADAVVIAGGEGWHHGHTYNQVGGALAFRHGITVLPYRDREAAYASLMELLVRRPAATGEGAPPVYLLLNEATKHRVRDPEDPEAAIRIAGIDDLLPPPLVARRIDLVEMFLDRLTPTRAGAPVRVTRDGLRMGLMKIEVDPARREQLESWRLRPSGDGWAAEGPSGLRLSGGRPSEGAPCLGSEPLTIELPTPAGSVEGARQLVLVASPGSAARTSEWSVEVDGRPIALGPVRTTPARRDTLGPITLPRRPARVVVRGAKRRLRRARCPHGGLAELHLLGPEAPMLERAEVSAVTFAPIDPLGHPVTPVAWVSGRGLSRYRWGIEPAPTVEGLSLVLEPGSPLRFPPAALPAAGRTPLELVVTITGASVHPEARVVVTADGEALPAVDPPDERRGSWQSVALPWTPSGPTAELEVELRHAGPDDRVWLRDIGLFSRETPRPGRRAR